MLTKPVIQVELDQEEPKKEQVLSECDKVDNHSKDERDDKQV